MKELCPFTKYICDHADCALYTNDMCAITAIANNLKKNTIEPVEVKNVEFVPTTRTSTNIKHIYDSPLPTTIKVENSKFDYDLWSKGLEEF